MSFELSSSAPANNVCTYNSTYIYNRIIIIKVLLDYKKVFNPSELDSYTAWCEVHAKERHRAYAASPLSKIVLPITNTVNCTFCWQRGFRSVKNCFFRLSRKHAMSRTFVWVNNLVTSSHRSGSYFFHSQIFPFWVQFFATLGQ